VDECKPLAGGLCIADEVQTGFGRTGTAFWGFQNQGVVGNKQTLLATSSDALNPRFLSYMSSCDGLRPYGDRILGLVGPCRCCCPRHSHGIASANATLPRHNAAALLSQF
jgi:hypothetical protein